MEICNTNRKKRQLQIGKQMAADDKDYHHSLILICSEDVSKLKKYIDFLRFHGFTYIRGFWNPELALEDAIVDCPDLIIIDMHFPSFILEGHTWREQYLKRACEKCIHSRNDEPCKRSRFIFRSKLSPKYGFEPEIMIDERKLCILNTYDITERDFIECVRYMLTGERSSLRSVKDKKL